MSSIPQISLRHRRTAGSVILLVLVTVLLAAFLLTKFVQRAGTELLADARAGDQARLRREAYSALEVTLAVLADISAIDNGLHSPAQGWDQPFDYADYTPAEGMAVTVDFEDESGKISLPRTDAATLGALLELLGVGRAEAGQAGDALLAWTQPGYVPASLDGGAGNYGRAPIPYHLAQRPLRSFAELTAVEYARDIFFDENGRPSALAREFAANVSLYSFDRMNLNAVTPAVLAAGGLAAGQIDALQGYVHQPDTAGGPRYFRSLGDATAILGADAPLQAFGADVRALRITVTVHGGATVFRLGAVIAPPGGATLAVVPAKDQPAPQETAAVDIKKLDYPFKVLEIRENVESAATIPAGSTAHD